jgi:Ala-tRNA(Pro) deacylase
MAQSRSHFKRCCDTARQICARRTIRAKIRPARCAASPVRLSVGPDRTFIDSDRQPALAKTREQLMDYLGKLGIKAEVVEHEPVFTVEESQALRGKIPGGHTKNLFLKCKKGSLWLVTALEDTVVDLKTLHQKLGSGRLSFGNADLLKEALGVAPGSVSTLCAINDAAGRVTVVLDAALMAHERINVHPLVNTATIGLARDDLVKFLKACNHEPRIMALI